MRESYILKGQEQQVCSALECYFVRQNLTSFKVKIQYDPYILLQCPKQNSAQVIQCIENIKDYPILIEQTVREDSSASNHVAGQLS